MPIKKKQPSEKLQQTVQLMGVMNLVIAPLYLLDPRIAIVVSLMTNALLLKLLNDLGKHRRPGSNAVSKLNRFFASRDESDSLQIDNVLRNIINGGALVYDEFISCVDEALRCANPPCHR